MSIKTQAYTVKATENTFSEICSFLSFVLMIGVILIHCRFEGLIVEENYTSYHIVSSLFSKALPSFCVPIFFFISGYYFIKNTEYTKTVYLYTLSKKVRTLLIPYILWNAICIIILLCRHTGLNYIFSLRGITDAFIGFPSGMPINVPLWFVRELLYMSVISPIIYMGIKHLGGVFIIVLLMLNLFLLNFTTGALLFFSMGMYSCQYNICMSSVKKKFNNKLITLSLIMVLVLWWLQTCGHNEHIEYYSFFYNLTVLGCIFSFLSGTSIVTKYNWTDIKQFSVFCYFSHGVFIGALKLRVYKTLECLDLGANWYVLGYFTNLIMTIGICYIIFMILRIFSPFVLNVLIGGR